MPDVCAHLGQINTSPSRFERFLQLASDAVHYCKPVQDVQMLRWSLEPLAQFARPLKSCQSFVCDRTSRSDYARTQDKLQVEFKLIPRCVRGQLVDRLYNPGANAQ